jgi:hypothetical protein
MEKKCKCCGTELTIGNREFMVPCYDDGGSVDSFDVIIEQVTLCTNRSCEGWGIEVMEVMEEPKQPPYTQQDDDLPF